MLSDECGYMCLIVEEYKKDSPWAVISAKNLLVYEQGCWTGKKLEGNNGNIQGFC